MRDMKAEPVRIDFDALWSAVTDAGRGSRHEWHGPDHWKRVERNACLLAARTGAIVPVIRLFAIFHDSCRRNDDDDPDHGKRGAEFAERVRGSWFDLPDDQFALLHYACVWHTDGLHHDDPTIGTCWDADRLDLGRVGLQPDARFMSTAFGREIASHGSMEPWLPGVPPDGAEPLPRGMD
jgi:uncharacterized protein